MARTAIAQAIMASNKALATDPDPYTAIDAANGMVVAHPAGFPKNSTVLLHVTNSGGADATVTIKKSDLPTTYVDDLVVTVPAGAGVFVGPVVPFEYQQNDGTYLVDPEAGMAGEIMALWVR
jgi:hypothetical protein